MTEFQAKANNAAVESADKLLAEPKDYVLAARADYWNGAHDGFKIGASWAFGQGLVYEGEVWHYGESGDTVYVEHPSTIRKKYAKMFKTGDKVIVQIRKK